MVRFWVLIVVSLFVCCVGLGVWGLFVGLVVCLFCGLTFSVCAWGCGVVPVFVCCVRLVMRMFCNNDYIGVFVVYVLLL